MIYNFKGNQICDLMAYIHYLHCLHNIVLFRKISENSVKIKFEALFKIVFVLAHYSFVFLVDSTLNFK